MIISVTSKRFETITLEIESTDTLENVNKKLGNVIGIDSEQLHLAYNSHILDEWIGWKKELPITGYGVKDNSILHLYIY